MKIGIFDSGLGGLLLTRSLVEALPQYDYVYLGDTARVPYGNRSQAAVYEFTKQAVEYLFNQDCQLIILACNTASAEALRRIQQEYLSKHYPERRVLGVIIPTAEATVAEHPQKIGVLATTSTVNSGTYLRELHKLDSHLQIVQQTAPLLVPLIENDGLQWIEPILESYLKPLREAHINTLILGCTHYPFIKDLIRQKLPTEVKVLSQDEIIPDKLRDYLERHPEIDQLLAKGGERKYLVTDLTENIQTLAKDLFGSEIILELVSLE
ncbi:MAG: glutamate racemase [Patescibacteria group bacterium]|jgi:glutamate racemase